MITANARNFDHWIRTSFCEMNTELEELYFIQENRANISQVGDTTKKALCNEGLELIARLVKEGNTDEGFEQGFNSLGDISLYGSLPPARNERGCGRACGLAAGSLGTGHGVGCSLGHSTRFATSHLTTHNLAINGRYKTFTSLEDEAVFINYNCAWDFCLQAGSRCLNSYFARWAYPIRSRKIYPRGSGCAEGCHPE